MRFRRPRKQRRRIVSESLETRALLSAMKSNVHVLQEAAIETVEVHSEGWDGEGAGSVDLTWYLSDVPDSFDLSQDEVQAAVEGAFEVWSDVVDISFTQTDQRRLDDSIDISFARVDGEGSVLAYAWLPDDLNRGRRAGDIVFDMEDAWEIGNEQGSGAFDFEYVLVHEIGHSLGLEHSDSDDAVLYESVSAQTEFTGLDIDDIESIQTLYAAAEATDGDDGGTIDDGGMDPDDDVPVDDGDETPVDDDSTDDAETDDPTEDDPVDDEGEDDPADEDDGEDPADEEDGEDPVDEEDDGSAPETDDDDETEEDDEIEEDDSEVDATLEDGVLIVNGTDDDDHILVIERFNRVVVWVNYDYAKFDADDVTSITINAMGGDDFVHAGFRFDIPLEINGGDGDDRLNGGRADDVINGGPGDDIMNGRRGSDIMNGDAGDDLLRGDSEDDTLDAGEGDNLILDKADPPYVLGEEIDQARLEEFADELFAYLDKDDDNQLRADELPRYFSRKLDDFDENADEALSSDEFLTALQTRVETRNDRFNSIRDRWNELKDQLSNM